LRQWQLDNHPLCSCPHCQEGKVRVRAALVVDHKSPHKGDLDLFYDPDNLQSYAKECHDTFKRSEEMGGAGFLGACDEEGLPLDPKHPWGEQRTIH